MEKNHGYINDLGKTNPDDPTESNQSVLKPFGVWVVISPFNFPMALSGAPIAAALVSGNTVVFKGASTTLYTGWQTAELFAEAGLPPGVFNYVSGPGRTVGQELQDNPGIDGWTFTGSYDVGMQVARNALVRRLPVARRSLKWAARTPRSFPSKARPRQGRARASCVRRLGWTARSARPARVSMCRQQSMTRLWASWSRRRRTQSGRSHARGRPLWAR